MGATLSLGTFTQSNAVLIGSTKGFYAALGGTLRWGVADLLDVGTDLHPSLLRFELVADAALSADLGSPLPQGPWAVRLALLPGLVYGSPSETGQAVGIYFGPAVFLGKVTSTHGAFALRFRMPLR